MEKIALPTSPRTTDDSVKNLRANGMVPAVIYGNTANTSVSIEEVALKKAYVKAGESTLVELEVGGKNVPVLFHALDFDPVSDRMIHVDFFAVDMNKEVETDVHIRLTGEAPAVKDLSAILVTALDSVTVRCLPANLPHDLPLDLSSLTEFGAALHVSDLVVPEGVEILNEGDETVVIAQEPREEEPEEVAPAAAVDADGNPIPPAEGTEGAPAAEGAAPAEGEKKDE